jgi:lysozyme
MGMTCTQEQAEQWLEQDVQVAVQAVNNLVTVALTQQQFDVLVDFTFNLGTGALQHSTLLRLLNSGNYRGAAGEFEKWDKAGGKVLPGACLSAVRRKEICLILRPAELRGQSALDCVNPRPICYAFRWR